MSSDTDATTASSTSLVARSRAVHVVRHGRLAAAGVIPLDAHAGDYVEQLRASAETVAAGPGPTPAASAEETEKVLRWLESPGIRLVRIDAKSGMRPNPGDGGKTILEAFKPGTAPPDSYSVVGVADSDGRVPQPMSPESDTILRPGTGRLY